MRITFVGGGAMGGSYGGLLKLAGHDVKLIDTWEAHVAAINRDGLRLDGAAGEHVIDIPAATAPEPGETADVVIQFVDTNNTVAAAKTVAGLLGDDGCAITFQNGIGNVEALQAACGEARVMAGSSMCSAASRGPGHVCLTHLRPTSLGETNGAASNRAEALASALREAGFEVKVVDNIMATIWQKFILNCAGNAIAATTGLRTGEIVRVPELDAFQSRVLDEAMAVTKAKGITMPNPDVAGAIKSGFRVSFNQPSMLQHVLAGRKTEIDAINGALLREADAFGIDCPYNKSLVALLKGRETAQMRAVHQPDLDYDAWEARIRAGEED